MNWYVYGLKEPDTGRIRYVGKSQNPARRLASHGAKSAAQPLREWFSELGDLGLTPELYILGEHRTEHDALVAEKATVSSLLAGGAKLLNSMPGGDNPAKRGRNPFSGLGERVRSRRIELGMTQLKLSEVSGVAAPTISRIEHGKREEVPAYTAVRIARALLCSTEWLVTGECVAAGVVAA